jgi:rod shape-determining protein MreD
MSHIKIAVVLSVAIVLQLLLREVWRPLAYIDFPLVVVVYIALQRDAWKALLVGTLAGLIIDAGSGGLVGAGGFSKTLTAYIIYFAATRVNLENPLLRIPVLAAGSLLDSAIYVFWHRVLGYPPAVPFVQTMSYKLIATTIVGTCSTPWWQNARHNAASSRLGAASHAAQPDLCGGDNVLNRSYKSYRTYRVQLRTTNKALSTKLQAQRK